MTIVQTIAAQIRPALVCKHSLVQHNENTLCVVIPSRGAVRYVTITYVGSSDTYSVKEGYMGKDLRYKEVNEQSGLYVEDLVNLVKEYA